MLVMIFDDPDMRKRCFAHLGGIEFGWSAKNVWETVPSQSDKRGCMCVHMCVVSRQKSLVEGGLKACLARNVGTTQPTAATVTYATAANKGI
jgi:hypothetical protein